jgi:hypothetical protein
MPRIITTPRLPRVDEGVLIKQAQLQSSRRAQTVLDETRSWARAEAKRVEDGIKARREQACRDGYRDGVLAGAKAIAAYFDGAHRLAQQMQEKLEQSARDMLAAALQDSRIVLALLDEWIGRQQQMVNLPLRLIVPRSANLTREQITARFDPSWHQRLQIEYGDSPRFVVQHGDEIAEFHPDGFASAVQQSLLHKLDTFYADCYALDQAALEEVQAIFAQQFAKRGLEMVQLATPQDT